MAQLMARATALYEQFATDPYMLPASRNYLFHRPLSTTVTLPQEVLASWIRSVEEGLYTREHRERLEAIALKRTLHNFFSEKPKPRKPPPVWKVSLWKPPFSKGYYKLHKVGGASSGNRVKRCCNTGSKNKVQRNHKRAKPPNQSLFLFGFQWVKPSVKVSKRDSNTKNLEELSGTRVSTAP